MHQLVYRASELALASLQSLKKQIAKKNYSICQIFSWMQSKLHAIRDTKKLNPLTSNDNSQQESSKEELNDWPHGLLAIGTFGDKNVKEITKSCNLQANNHSQDHPKDITRKEVGNLKKDLNVILDRQVPESNSADEPESHNILLDQIFKSSSNSNIERTSSYTESDDIGDNDSRLQRINGTVLMKRGKDNRLNNTKNAIKKESMTFLLKKMLKSDITSTPNLRDTPPEARLEKSRMDEIFRAMLNKKIFPQSFNPKATSTKKYLNNKQYCRTDGKKILPEDTTAGSKWVKTDSDFIVLEI
ncbi:Protein DEEPER ROOTING 1 [Heracleum sosnowskyi]|uniref:Protein DEEPER ROOTING 1 n=1 Tax=Heracleum sosnowskyi TaxID=360622 RepID=A0AAD8MM74_9APIA|nr:Protein DEEPER ROOTING 1 [Heracleum sosnowskyi]